MPDLSCAAILLAAGASTRLGQPKQLVRVGRESLLRRTVRLGLEAGASPLYVVLGFDADRMREELAGLPVETVLNPAWQEGMGSSVSAGAAALAGARPRPDAALLLVCDQPRLCAGHLKQLLALHAKHHLTERKAITASLYAHRAGVPAIFSSAFFEDLAACSGDHGARDLMRGHPAKVRGIPWPAGELDLDRPEDLTAIEA